MLKMVKILQSSIQKWQFFHVEPHLVSFCDNRSVLDSAYPSLGSAGRLGRKRVKVVSAKKKKNIVLLLTPNFDSYVSGSFFQFYG